MALRRWCWRYHSPALIVTHSARPTPTPSTLALLILLLAVHLTLTLVHCCVTGYSTAHSTSTHLLSTHRAHLSTRLHPCSTPLAFNLRYACGSNRCAGGVADASGLVGFGLGGVLAASPYSAPTRTTHSHSCTPSLSAQNVFWTTANGPSRESIQEYNDLLQDAAAAATFMDSRAQDVSTRRLTRVLDEALTSFNACFRMLALLVRVIDPALLSSPRPCLHTPRTPSSFSPSTFLFQRLSLRGRSC